MYIHEFGDRTHPTIILLAPMMLTGSDLYREMAPYFKGQYHVIAPDLGGHGLSGRYISAHEEYRQLKAHLSQTGQRQIALVYGASLGVSVGYRLLMDDDFTIDHAWFDGAAFHQNAKALELMMKSLFRLRKKQLASSEIKASPSLRKTYGDEMAKVMTKNFKRLSLKEIDRMCYDCTHYNLKPVSYETQSKLHLDYCEDDLTWLIAQKTCLQYMPFVAPVIREDYGHCAYLSANMQSYVAEIEAFMKETTLRYDHIPTHREQIKSAYRLTGDLASFYDGMITYTTPLGKAICRIVWNMDGPKNLAYLEKALSAIPEDFSGRLLEVPVGTGVLTMPIYQHLPDASITCLDYSEDMLAVAKKRAEFAHIEQIAFLQGDVGALPFDDEAFDLVVSLNGFHAFYDKEAAYRETHRVLKKGGIFCGCFYIKGENTRTDWFIKHLYEPKGFFTPPYETKESLYERLSTLYTKVEVTNVEGIACFECIK